MKYRVLGKTNLLVSEVGCGGIPIQKVSQDEARKIVNELLKQGINFIDSARGYTNSEELFGNAIKGKREKFIIATKSPAATYKDMQADIKKSLSEFQTDYIDLYQLHNIKSFEERSGAIDALIDAKNEGLIKHIGLTSHSFDFVADFLNNKTFLSPSKYDVFETIQFPYNFLEEKSEELFLLAKEKNIGVIVMKPLAGGNIDKGNVAIKYILQNENVATLIPGMKSVLEVRENASITDYSLTIDDKEYISKMRQTIGKDFCHRCGYCMPCSVGIDIPSCFMFENYYKNYSLKEWAKNRYDNLQVKASSCIKCHKCEARCPYDLKIVERLARVKEIFE